MASPQVDLLPLKVVSYNMHGFHQGQSTVSDLITDYKPELFLLQEHWLTPANLYLFDTHFANYFSIGLFDTHFANYFSIGSSAMSKCVGQGILRGRPFGGTIILIKNDLRQVTHTVHCDERYVIVKVTNYLFVNVYMPC